MEERRSSRFTAPSVSTNKQAAEAAAKQVSRGGGRVGYHQIEEGKNVFRIAPPHDGENNPSLQPICKLWLPREVEVEEGGRKKTVVKDMPVFNSKVHSPIGRDLVEEYVKFAMDRMYKDFSKDEAKKKLAPVTGYRDKSGKWVRGLSAPLAFICYAWDSEGQFARLEISKTVSDRMNDLSIDEEGDEVISVDPFSDPVNGVSLIITYDKSLEASKRYKVSKGSRKSQLTEEQEEELMKATPLVDLFQNAFTHSDFYHQLEGLRIFDEKEGFHFFDMEEWILICEEIEQLVTTCPVLKEKNERPDDASDDADIKAAPTKVLSPAPKKVEAVRPTPAPTAPADEDDGLDDLEIDELREFIESNNLGIVIKPAHTKSAVIRAIRAAVANRNAGITQDEVASEDKDETNADLFVEDRVKTGLSAREMLRQKRGQNGEA